MAPSKQPVSLLDLPLELRQEIYERLLPSDLTITIDPRIVWDGERTINAVCASHPQVNRELREWVNKRCRDYRFVIAPDTTLPSSSIRYDKLLGIEGFIDYCDDDGPNYGWPLESSQLRVNIEDFVDILRRYAKLNVITICFRDEPCVTGEKGPRGDPNWCCSLTEHELVHVSMLKQLGATGCALVDYLLRLFLRLSVCEVAVVERLAYVADAEYDTRDGLDLLEAEASFDRDYTITRFTAIEAWLEDRRDIPFEECSKGDGRYLENVITMADNVLWYGIQVDVCMLVLR